MEDLAKSGEEGRAIKCSTRDLPLAASNVDRLGSGDAHWGGEYDAFNSLHKNNILMF